MWRAAAFAALVLALPPTALAQTAPAQEPSAVEATEGNQVVSAEVLAAFKRLVARGEARPLFGLPEDAFWRRQGDLTVALLAAEAGLLRAVYQGAAAPFAAATGLPVDLVESGPVPAAGNDVAAFVPAADLVIVVGPRGRLVELATGSGFNRGMLARFEIGTWPFMFAFAADGRRRGVVLLADDEPERAREASFILATVWALGGVTLGPELTGLVTDAEEGPMLTPLGAAVFGLFFHPDLEVGMPLADAVRRAETLLPQ
ncbi:MAG: hypothetical protein Kow00114_38620 [Kiloniellaceae bacterium]